MQKILIVEDEKAISGVLQNILSEEVSDYEILVAEDGLEAFKIIEKDAFDDILHIEINNKKLTISNKIASNLYVQ